jgi:molybdopterin converting factor small subunit
LTDYDGSVPKTIDVTVRLFASLKDLFAADQVVVSVAAATPVGAIWGHLADRADIGLAPAGLRYAINDEWTIPGAPLRDGDRVALVLPVSGG